MKTQLCEICGRQAAICLCDGCGRMLCGDCQIFEIWGTEPQQAETKHFCPRCYNDSSVNPWLAHDVAAGLGELLRLVRRIEDGDKLLMVAF